MKSVLISISPKWCEKICHKIGKDENDKPIYEKRIEVRKSAPSEVPFKVYIYCTKAKSQCRYSCYEAAYENSKGEFVYTQQHIIGEFICDKVYLIKNLCDSFSVAYEKQSVTNEIARQSCLDYYDMVDYLGNKDGYAWHISDLKIYDKPKELSEFRKPFIDYVSPKESKMVNPKIGISEYVTCPPQSWIYVEELK